MHPNLVDSEEGLAAIVRQARTVAVVGMKDGLALPPARRPRVVWMQTGISHAAAAERLARAGMLVVQNHCMKVLATRYRDAT